MTPAMAPATVNIEKIFRQGFDNWKKELDATSGLMSQVAEMCRINAERSRENVNDHELKSFDILSSVIVSLSSSISRLQVRRNTEYRDGESNLATKTINDLMEFKKLTNWLDSVPPNTSLSDHAKALKNSLLTLSKTLNKTEKSAEILENLRLQFGEVFNQICLIQFNLLARMKKQVPQPDNT